MSFLSMMDTVADVTRITTGVDEIGGSVETETTPYEAMPCRIDMLSANERAMSGSVGIEATHRLFCASGFAIQDTDVITIGTDVYDVAYPAGVHGHHMEIKLKERRPPR